MLDNRPQSTKPSSALSAGAGEMARLVQAKDWSKTALGPTGQWSPALRMTVDMLLANGFPMLLWWGPDYISIYNDAYRPILGTKHPDALGRPFREVWAEIAHVLIPLIDTPFKGGPPTWMDDIPLEVNRHGFVEETHFTIAYSPVPDATAASGIGGVLATVHEITEKIVGERRMAALRELGARSGSARSAEEACVVAASALAAYDKDVPFAFFYLLDQSGTRATLTANVGRADVELDPPSIVALFSPNNGGDPWRLTEAMQTRTTQLVGDAAQQATNTGLPGTLVTLPINSAAADSVTGFLVVGVSPRLRFDEHYTTFLDLLVAQVASSIAGARAFDEEKRRAEALADIDRAKTVFFSNVSHEFRTPLTLMLGPLEELRNDLGAPGCERFQPQLQQIDLIDRNAQRLLKLTNTLLDFARIEAGRIEACYQPTDLATVTCELASVFRSAIERAGLTLKVDCSDLADPAYVDREMWEKIVLNLISNAFKFTLEGEIEVILRREDQQFVLTVRDTGTGIPPHELARVFERFHRIAGAVGRTHEGSGIGLALVHELVRLHGGTVTAESTVARGTTFKVVIPVGKLHLPADQIAAEKSSGSTALGAATYVREALRWLPNGDDTDVIAAPSTRPLSNGRILVVDDNADMRDYLARVLGQRYDVTAVGDGQAALAWIARAAPDLVLTDIMMPNLDGFELLSRLRADPRTSALPIIVLSARAGEESRVEGLLAKADDYLTKPFSARELLARVQSQLELARVRRLAAEDLRQRTEQLEALINSAPIGVYLVDADFRLRHVNPTAASVLGDIPLVIGRDFDEFVHALRSKKDADEVVRIFRHTLTTGESYVTSETIQHRIDRGTAAYYEWRVDRIPMPDGRNGVVCYFRDISAEVEARREIAAGAERLRRVLETDAVGVLFFEKASGTLINANDAFLKMTGYSREEVDSRRLNWQTMTPQEYFAVSETQVERLEATGRIGPYEKEYIHKDGSRSWMMFAGRDLGDGTLVEFAMDISDRKRAEDHIRLLMREVNHRSKNLLTLILAVARQTASGGAPNFIRRFSDRVQALSASQDVLVKSDWKSIPIDELVNSQLAHFSDPINGRITMAGPRLGITAAAAQTLGMSLHELATNAAKYGALSQDSGRIEINWRLGHVGGRASTFEISWVERGGPPVTRPQQRGFGTTVLATMAKLSLGGEVALDFSPQGVTWRLSCPASKVIETDGAIPSRKSAAGGIGKRVLVVDDEALISLEIASLLTGAGLDVVGPATSVSEALMLIEAQGCDAAVLDINLGRETAEPIARQLKNGNIPFVTVSGFSRDQQPPIFQATPFLSKPLRGDLLIAAVKRCLSEASPVRLH